jgi:hypothetical protein
MSKLPSDVRIQIARNTTKDVWDIRELLDVIQKEVEAREVCENIKTHSDNQNKKPNAPALEVWDRLQLYLPRDVV